VVFDPVPCISIHLAFAKKNWGNTDQDAHPNFTTSSHYQQKREDERNDDADLDVEHDCEHKSQGHEGEIGV
jgi:hypothetical protein